MMLIMHLLNRSFLLFDVALAGGTIEAVNSLPVDDVVKYTCQAIVSIGALVKIFVDLRNQPNNKTKN